MVKHVILWQLKEEYDEEQKAKIKQGIKEGLEGLQGKIPGLLEIKVYTDPLKTANSDVMLDSKFESEAALNGYTVHPDHVEVATTKVRPFVSNRVVMDCEA
ncbi:MAG: Dabb family protein [Lachnospiraceae bacterium]|nr:Dabb family protein [Lachnospiraceae bacterium]